MARTYAEIKRDANSIAADLTQIRSRLIQAIAAFASVSADVTTLQGKYGTWAADVDAYAAALPASTQNDTLGEALKAEKDQLVAEFITLKNQATSYDTAVKAV